MCYSELEAERIGVAQPNSQSAEVGHETERGWRALSRPQEGLWFQERVLGGTGSRMHVPVALRVRGGVDRGRLVAALQSVVRRQPALRSRFDVGRHGPRWRVVDDEQLDMELRGPIEETSLADAMLEEVRRPRNLAVQAPVRFVLYDVRDGDPALLVVVHHLVWDTWSTGVFLEEIAAAYDGTSLEVLPRLSNPPGDFEELLRCVRKALHGVEVAPELPLAGADHPRRGMAGGWVRRRWGRPVLERLSALARRHRTTGQVVVQAALRILIWRMGGPADGLIGVPMTCRSARSHHHIGCFVNLVPTRAAIDGAASFDSAVLAERRAVLDGLTRRELSLADVVRAVRPGASPLVPLVRLTCHVQRAHPRSTGSELELEWMDLGGSGVLFDLALEVELGAEGAQVGWAFDLALFEPSVVENLADRFTVLLDALLCEPSRPVGLAPALTELDERLLRANDPVRSPEPGSVPDQFFAWVERTPAAMAVRCGARSQTYRETATLAADLAGRLHEAGLGPEDAVAVLVDRTVELPGILLGVLAAGCVLVPLDPDAPPARVRHMVAVAGACAVVGSSEAAGGLGLDLPSIRVPQAHSGPLSWGFSGRTHPWQAAYIQFTSGSTGVPKGAVVNHAGLANCLREAREMVGFSPGESMVAATPVTFDVALLELLLALVSGGTVIVAPGDPRDGSALRAVMEANRPAYLQATPILWKLLFAAGWQGQDDLVGMVGGDVVHPGLARMLLERLGTVHHTYGPTEASIHMVAERVIEVDDPRIPLGRPFGGTWVAVVDQALRRVPPGVTGELCIGGVAVGRGYVGSPAATAEKFVPAPFEGCAGERMYRTGDRARLRLDGRLELLGRSDRQVKIRGQRIELAEIEQRLRACSGVRDACAVVLDAGADQARVAAMIEPEEPTSGDAWLASVRAELSEHLTPAAFPRPMVVVPQLPALSRGKVDSNAVRAALVDARSRADGVRIGDEPLVRDLARIWADVLGVDIRSDEDFFELGGNSLAVLHVVGLIEERLGVRVAPLTLFVVPRFVGFVDQVRRERARNERYAQWEQE